MWRSQITSSPKEIIMSQNKNYNVLALRGVDMDDMEYVEEFGLDPKVAYTPAINDAMLDKMYQQNMEYYRREGFDEKEAVKQADRYRAAAKDTINKLTAKALH